jgi:glycosyltransferase involved in cell wall biosynthesis
MQKISAVIITKNEEKIIAKCLGSLKWVNEIIVIDCGSEDNTVEIAKQYGAKVYFNEWQGYAKQKNFGIAKAKNDWILSLDADEIMTDELIDEIKSLPDSGTGKSGFFIARKNMYYGKWLRYGKVYPDKQLRLFNKHAGNFGDVEIHECVNIKGATDILKNPMIHYTKDSIKEHIECVNKYSTLHADMLLKKGYYPTGRSIFLKPFFHFLKRYFLKLGFLDGYHGLVHHAISAMCIYKTQVKVMKKLGLGKVYLLRTLLKKAK